MINAAKPWLLPLAKITGVVLLLVAVPGGWESFFYEKITLFAASERYYILAFYLVILLVSLLAVITCPFLRNFSLRGPTITFVLLAFAADQLFFDFTGTHLSIAKLQIIWAEREWAGETWTAFIPYALRNFPLLIMIMVILAWAPPARFSLPSKWLVLPVLAIGLSSMTITYTRGGTQEFLPPFSLPASFGFAFAAPHEERAVAALNYDATPRAELRSIVFIVDESVRGDYLGINNVKLKNSPFLSKHQDRLINFGVAASGANCSNAARWILRNGLNVEQLDAASRDGRIPATPSIWQYAKQAGFRTVLLDPFRDSATYLNSGEWQWIDMYVPFTDIPTYERDRALAEKLSLLLKEPVPSFIYVNKFGVHFPYELSLPPEFEATKRTSTLAKLATLVGYSQLSLANREEVLATYITGILWTVDGFFEKLLPTLDLSNMLIIYTSDHGQNLFEGSGRIGHCSIENAGPGEGRVPLFALTKFAPWEHRLRKSSTAGFNQATHFEIFPTLLMALGYDEHWVIDHYGFSLMDVPLNRRRQFLTIGDGRQGSWTFGAKWAPID